MIRCIATRRPIRKAGIEMYGELLKRLEERFQANMHRHQGIEWEAVRARLRAVPDKLCSLQAMEETGGEPDVIGVDEQGHYIFCDCSPESPAGRRNTCYDRSGQDERERKGVYPQGNAVDGAAEMGIELLDEEQYRALQQVGPFDTKTSSWIKTPEDMRKKGGALFGDYRYGRVFFYHNSAGSFYSSRGFRGLIRV
ncbi:MAG: hypothetical protein AA931_01285 [Peptococcaceae bacterium 1109]|nr:MAG: hypothetical protein AA931_01285 [Peptococcaceae bacterium 1109]